MGLKIHYVGRKQQYRSFEDNIEETIASYPLDKGYFGTKGKSRNVREIHSKKHEVAAKDFFNKIAKGGILDLKTLEGAVISRMKDGTTISYRKITSSKGSPAVEIRFHGKKTKYGINDQKIHFVNDN